MAGIIKIKRSAVPGKIPTIDQMGVGELALNTFDGRLFARGNNGFDYVQEFARIEDAGGGGASVQPAEGYQVIIPEKFPTQITTDAKYKLSDLTTATYDVVNKYEALLCDKTKTATTTGTAFTISGAPSFSISVGDIIWSSTQRVFRRVATKTSSTTGTLASAFPTNLASGSAVMISQAVWTKDLTNLGDATQLNRPRDIFPNTSVPSISIDYRDTYLTNDTVADETATPSIVVSASNSGLSTDTDYPVGSTFSPIFARPLTPALIPVYNLTANTNQQRLFLVFFCNPDNALVTTNANLLSYEASFYEDGSIPANGGYIDSCFAMTDGSGVPNNCVNPTTVSGFTQWKIFPFVASANFGKTAGEIEVLLDGKSLPKYVAGSTVDAYWDAVPNTTDTIQFWKDLSTLATPLSIEVRKRQGSIDSSQTNSGRIDANTASITAQTAALTAFQALVQNMIAPVGTYQFSDLTEPQFQAQSGTGWILCDGRDVTGSKFAQITGRTTVRDARGLFLRGKNNGRVDGAQNPDGDLALGTYQGDAFGSHNHTRRQDGASEYSFPIIGGGALPGGGGTSQNIVSLTGSAGTNETRSKNLTANIFIRIN